MKKETSDLAFNRDIIHIFFADYSYIYADDFMYSIHADLVYTLDTYGYLWVYRELIDTIKYDISVDDISTLVSSAIGLYPDLKTRKIDLRHNFKDFIEMGKENLAIFAIQLLEGV